jgi:hypothetical protein
MPNTIAKVTLSTSTASTKSRESTRTAISQLPRESDWQFVGSPNARRAPTPGQPRKVEGDVHVYSSVHCELAVGDRVQFRIHDKKNGVANGEFATMIEFISSQARLRFDNGRELSINFSQLSTSIMVMPQPPTRPRV